MTITFEALKSCENRADELEKIACSIGDEITALYKSVDYFRDIRKSDKFEDFKKKSDDLDTKYKDAKKAHRIEMAVYTGMATQFLDNAGRLTLRFMLENVEKFAGQKTSFKRPTNALREFGSEIGVRIWMDSRFDTLEINHPERSFRFNVKNRSIYVASSKWDGRSSVARFDAEEIERELARYEEKPILTEDEIRESAHMMFEEIDQVEQEKKRVNDLVTKTSKKYTAIFGTSIEELNNL